MDRKAVLRFSFLGLATILLVASLFFSFIPLTTSSTSDVYFAGESVKLQFASSDACIVKVTSPQGSSTTKASGNFVLQVSEVGEYTVSVRSCPEKSDYTFTVIPHPDSNIKETTSTKTNDQNSVPLGFSGSSLRASSTSTSDLPEEEIATSESMIIAGKPVSRIITVHPTELEKNEDGEFEVSIPSEAEEIIIYDSENFVDGEKEIIEYEEEKGSFGGIFSVASSDTPDTTLKITESEISESPIEVSYVLPGPEISQKEFDEFHKEVTVSAPHEFGYENVLAYYEVDGFVSSKKNIKVHWKNEGIDMDFAVFDTDNDGYIDYIQWVVPHLSEQKFDIILISAAEYRDENREFIEDIFESVFKRDGILSPVISNGEFVRVTFERNLSQGKDITVLPHIISGNPIIEVYEKDDTNVLAVIDSLKTNTYSKVYLDSFTGSQDVFDLKVTGGELKFDHIIDPVDPPTNDTFETVAPWNWSQPTYDNCDWSRNADNDGTPSGQTGPEQDHTLGTISGHFLFTEATAGNPCEFGASNTASLESQEYDADSYNITFEWWFHMFGLDMGDLVLEVNDSNGWHTLWTQSGPNQSAQGDAWVQDSVNVGNYSGIIKFRFNGTTGSGYRSDMSIDDLYIFGTVKNVSPTSPTGLTCDTLSNCDVARNTGVTLNCSGSTDVDGDAITYFVESAAVGQDAEVTDHTNVSFASNGNIGSNFTIWTKVLGAGCSDTWTGDSSWTTAEFRVVIDGDKTNTSLFDQIRYSFCAGTDENLQVLNASVCWIDEAAPAADATCTDSLVTNTGEGTTGDWFYTEIASGTCEFTTWMDYDWNGTRNYFVQWGSQDGTNIDGNRYVSGCTDSDISRVQNTNADVMNPSWVASEAYDAFIYDLHRIEGRSVSASTDENGSLINYTNFDSDYVLLNNLTITVAVDSYDPSASVLQGSDDPDLYLEVYNGTGWYQAGYLTINTSYTGNSLDTTDYNFSMNISDAAVLDAWRFQGNQSFRIKATHLDFVNASYKDAINFTSIHTLINGNSWTELGNHTPTTTVYWNVSELSDRENVDFRCKAIDLDASNKNSSYFLKGASFSVDHTNPVVNFTTGTLPNGSITYHSYLFVNVTLTELHENNITFRIYNESHSLVNETTLLSGNYSLNFSGLTSGVHFYNVTAFDEVNLSGSSTTRNITIDITPPQVAFDTLTEINTSNVSRDYFSFNISVVEPNEKNVTFRRYNATGFLQNTTTYTAPIRYINYTSMAEGTYYYNATVTDLGNRSNSTPTYRITLDETKPTWELVSPDNETFSNQTSQNLTVNISDSIHIENATLNVYNSSGSLINQTTYIVGGGLTALVGIVYEFLYDGIFTWFYVISDVGGNTVTTANRTITIDTVSPNISIMNMLNNSADADGFITFTYNLTDLYSTISNCSLYFGETLNQTNYSITLGVPEMFELGPLPTGRYNWSITCFDISGNPQSSALRYFDVIPSTSFDGLSTDLTQVDTSSISNLVLERGLYGRIEFNQTVNLSGGANLNNLVTITDSFIEIDSVAEPRLDRQATLFMYSLDYVFEPILYKNSSFCSASDCSLISYSGGNLSFNVSGFSNFSLSENSRLDIWDETDPEEGSQVKYANDDIKFFANYTNITDGSFINETGICEITFSSGTSTMTFNSTSLLYEYNRSFSIYGTYDWDVFCNGTSVGYEPLTVSDTVDVSTLVPSNNPEYGFKVQTGGHEIVSTATHIIDINPVNNISRAFVMPSVYYATGQENITPESGGGAQTDHDWADYTIHLQNESAINVTRRATDANILMGWQVIEATSGEFEVFRGEADVSSSGLVFDIPIGATVNASNSMAWVTGYRTDNTGRDIYDRLLMRAYVENDTHFRVQRLDGTASNIHISWVVVEWNMSHIDSFQTGNDTVVGLTHTNAAPLQVTLPESVNTSNSIMLFQMGVDNSGLDQVAVVGYLAGSTTLEFYTGSSGTTTDSNEPRPLRWYVIDFGNDAGHRERGQIDESSNANWFNEDVTLSQTIDRNRTISFVTNTHDGTGDAQPRPFPFSWFPNDTTLNIYRTRFGQESRIEWQVLELPYAINPDAPQFFNAGVNRTYAKANETVRINVTVNDSTHEVDYVNALISGNARDFINNSDEWYYDWICNESMVVNFSWAIARDTGDPVLFNTTNISNASFICDYQLPNISFSILTQANNTFTRFPHYFVSVNTTEANFANITFEIHNDSGLVNRTTYATLVEDINFTGLVTGTYYYNATITDLALQSNSTRTRYINVDIDNPLVDYTTGTQPNNSVVSGESVFVNVTVTEDNEENITFTLYNATFGILEQDTFTDGTRTINWTLLSEDTYYYDVKVTDSVNRQNTTVPRRITIDNSFPTISFVDPTPVDVANRSLNWFAANVSVSISNEANITFRLYNSSHTLINTSFYTTPVRLVNYTDLNETTYYYNVTVIDLAGRNDTTETRSVRIDTVFPLINLVSPAQSNTSNLSATSIPINVSFTELYPKNFSFTLHNVSGGLLNTTWVNYTSGSSQSFNFIGLGDGIYYYNVTIFDFSGNENLTLTRQITLDTNAPQANLTSPVNDTYHNNATQNLTVNATDGIELANTTLFVYNSTGNLINQTTYIIGGGLTALVGIVYEFLYDGIFSWFYSVTDIAGNTFNTQNNTITIDRVAPNISFVAPTEANYTNFTRNWFFINVTLNDTNFANVTFTADGPTFLQVTYSDGNRSHNFTNLSDGRYYYNVTVIDLAGNSNVTETRNIGLDNVGPSINIIRPESIIYSTNISLPLNYSISDLVELDSCWWNLDGGANNTIACGTNTTFNTTDGSHTLYFFSNDTFGHVGSDSVSFSVSLFGPIIVLNAPVNETFYDQATNVLFNYSASDPNGVDTCSLWGDFNGTWHLNQSDSNQLVPTFVNFFDNFNDGTLGSNWTTAGSNGFSRIDVRNDQPSANSGSFAVAADSNTDSNFQRSELVTNQDFTTARNIILDFYIADWSDETHAASDHTTSQDSDGVFYTCDGNNWYVIYDHQPASQTDNTWVQQTINISADPDFCSEINSSFAIKFQQYDNFEIATDGIGWDDITINYTADLQKPWGNFTLNLSTEGSYNWNIQCNDTNNFQSFALDNWTFAIDTTSPLIDYTLGTSPNNTNESRDWAFINVTVTEGNEANITFNLYNETGGLVNASLFNDSTRIVNFSSLNDSIYYYNVTVIDLASRVNSTQTRRITLDTTNPNATIIIPENNSYQSNTTQNLTINATDNIEVENVTLFVYNETGNLINQTTTYVTGGVVALVGTLYEFLYDGIFNWFYLITDIGGNTFSTQNQTVTIDTAAPNITFTPPTQANASNDTVNWVFVNTSVEENNFANITFVIEGPEYHTQTYTDGNRSHNFTDLLDGLYIYNVTIFDLAGNSNFTETREITLETVAPVVTINDPQNTNYSIPTVPFNVSINEAGFCNFTIDGGQTNYTMDTTDNLVFNYTNSSMIDGDYTARYFCRDLYGNLNDSANVSFSVDASAPQISFALPTEENNTYVNRDWIIANVTVTEQNEKNITFVLVGPESSTNTFTNMRRDVNWTLLDEGVYYYNVTVADISDNLNSTETRRITLDRTLPVVNYTTGTELNHTNKSQTFIFINVSVGEAYPSNITYRLYNASGLLNSTTLKMADNTSNTTFTFSGLTDNTYEYSVFVTDFTGSSNTENRSFITLDTTLPIVTYVSPTEANGTQVERNWIFVNVTVDELYETNITFELYNASGLVNSTLFTNQRRVFNFTNLASSNITYSYNVTVRDSSSNRNASVLRQIELIDTTPPTLLMYSPEDDIYDTNVSLPLSYLASDLNLDTCWYNLNNGTNITLPNCQGTTFDVADEQNHTLYLFANDSMGNTVSTSANFFVNSSLLIGLRYRPVGEYGHVTDLTSAWQTVSFKFAFNSTPVVVHTVEYDYDYDVLPCATRIRNVTDSSFEIRSERWNSTANCPSTGVNAYFLAMEKGIYNISNNGTPVREVEVQNFTMQASACGDNGDWTQSANHRYFNYSWSFQPIVFGSVQTANDDDVITSYIRGCSTTNGETWNTTCVEIGMSGMQAGGSYDPCALHGSDEEGGYIAWEMESDWSGSEVRDNVGNTGDGLREYAWEAYWENDNVAGGDNDPFPLSSYSATLSSTFVEGTVLGSNIRIDGADGVLAAVDFDSGSNQIFFLADEDEYADNERAHAAEPFQALFFNTSSGTLFSDELLIFNITINDPLNTFYNGDVIFNVTTSLPVESCTYSLDNGITDHTMTSADTFTWNATNSSIIDGNYTVNFSCADQYGNEVDNAFTTFVVDKSEPAVIIFNPRLNYNYSNATLDFNFSATDTYLQSCWYTNDSGVTNYSLPSCLNTTYVANENTTLLLLYANDSAGNIGSRNVSFFVDTIFPLITYAPNAYAHGAIISGTSVFVNVTATEQNEENITFDLYNGTNATERTNTFTDFRRDVTWTLLSEGTYYYNVTLVDRALNTNYTGTRQITLDNTAPVVAYVDPTQPDHANVSRDWVFINVTVTETNEANITFVLFNETQIVNETTLLAGNRSFNFTNLPDGLYNYNVTVLDAAGNNGSTSDREIRLDTVNPSILFTTGTEANNTVHNQTFIYMNVTASDLFERNVTFSLFSSSHVLLNGTTLGAGSREITFTSLADGLYYYNVTVRDFSSNENTTETRQISLDNTGPVVNIIHPQPTAYGYNTSLPLNYSVSDLFSAVDDCWYSVDEGPNVTLTCGVNTTFNVSGDGEHNVTLYANDTFGNVASDFVSFLVSTTGPVITLNEPLNDTYYATDPVDVFFNYTPQDPDGVVACSLYGSWNGGWHLNHTNFTIYNVTPNNFSVTIDTEGSYLWNVECNDTLGFYSFGFKNFTLGIDLTNPLVEYQSPTEVNESNFSRNWVAVSANVTDLNIQNITFTLTNNSGYYNVTTRTMINDSVNETFNFTNLVDGRYYYNVTVYDKASRTNSTITRTILLDTVNPEANLTNPDNNTFQSNATQNFSASILDNIELSNATLFIFNSTGALINQTTVVLTGAVTATVGILYEFLYDGIFTWFYQITDFVGNIYTTENRTITIDTTASGITYVPQTSDNNTYAQLDWVFVNVTINETNFANITFDLYREGTLLFSNDFSDSTRQINWTLLVDNYYHYNVTVVDLAGNTNTSETRRITLDNIDPNVVGFGLGTQGSGEYTGNNWVYVNATVIEVNPANITFNLYNAAHTLVNSTTLLMPDTETNNTLNFTGLADGLYYYNLTVYDLAGAFGVSTTRNITVDATNPGVLFDAATEANNTEFERNWIYANVTISETNFANVTFNLYNASGLVNSTNYSNITYLINWTNLASANVTYEYNVTVIDLAGNSNTTETRQIDLVDTTVPDINLSRPENTTYGDNESIPLQFTITDLNTESCWYNLDGGANITVTDCASTTFAVADEQTYTLFFFANDSVGLESSANVTFSANTSFIAIDDYIIQRGTASVDGSQDAGLTVAVPASKSFIMHTSRSAGSGPNSLQMASTFVDSTTINFENYAAGSGGTVEWEVISGPGITTQRNKQAFGTGDSSFNIDISEVNLSNSFIVVSSRVNSATGGDNVEGFFSCSFFNTTRIVCDRGVTGTEGDLSWQVVSWEGTEVQNGTTTLASTTTNTASVNAVNLTTTFIISSFSLASDTSIQDIFTRAYFTNDNTIQFERTGNGGTLTADWFTVSAPFFRIDNDTYAHLTGTTAAQADAMNRNLINLSQAFNVHTHENAGGGTSFGNGFVTQRIANTTTLEIQKGTTSNDGTTSWFTIEIVDIVAPVITLTYPDDTANFSTHEITTFNYTVADDSSIDSCTLYGNWSGAWAANGTNFTVTREVNQFFSGINVSTNGYYEWSVECNDTYGNTAFASANRTFAAYLPPTTVVITNITQNASNGTGAVTIYWNASNHTTQYRIYSKDSFTNSFTLLDTTSELNYTDTSLSSQKRRFYNITAINPVSINSTSDIYAYNTYTLRRLDGVNSRNRIGFFMNVTHYLEHANDTLNQLGNISSVAQWNNTLQKRRVCTDFSCPNYPLCTDTNCNFKVDYGSGYEVYINTSGPVALNFSTVGQVIDPIDLTLIKNSSSFGKNWVSMYTGSTLVDAHNFITNITTADAVTYWNETLQTSVGYIVSPFPFGPSHIGTNFSMSIDYGYEVSVTADYNWTQF